MNRPPGGCSPIVLALAGVLLAAPAAAVQALLTDDAHTASATATRNFGGAPTLLVQGAPRRAAA